MKDHLLWQQIFYLLYTAALSVQNFSVFHNCLVHCVFVVCINYYQNGCVDKFLSFGDSG